MLHRVSAPDLLDGRAVVLARAVRAGEARAVDLVRESLRRAERLQASHNAFVTLATERALARAEALDAALARGDAAGPLAGVPVAVKDNLCTLDLRTTAGSKSLEDYHPPFDATVVARLEAAGAIVVAKTNLDEFGMGGSSEHSAFGAVRNPWDADRVAGGSSGGSAAAVAAGVVPLALGTDTGGSVRQPAAFCGVLGLKPTYGTLSRYGVVAFASSLDQVGVLARDAGDLAGALDVLVGRDPCDATTVDVPAAFGEAAATGADGEAPLAGVRVGCVRELLGEGNDEDVERAVGRTRAALEALGAEVREVSVPHARAGVASYHLVASSEAGSNLNRYDGAIIGARHGRNGDGQAEVATASRAHGLGREVRRRVLMGSFALSAGYADAWYGRALRVRRRLADAFEAAFAEVDLLLTPTAPTAAFRLGQRDRDPLAMYLGDVDTCLANLVGGGAVSVPAGRGEGGLPASAQLMAPALHDARLLRAAAALQARAGAAFAPLVEVAPGRGARSQ